MHSITMRQKSKPALRILDATEKCGFLPEEKTSVLTRRGKKLNFFVFSVYSAG